MSGAPVRLLAVLAVTLAAGSASAQLCAPAVDPCVVVTNVTLPGGTIVDLGGRDLVLQGTATVTVQGAGGLTLSANDITLAPGAKIEAPGLNGLGGSVGLYATGAVVMGASSKIDTTGGSAGDVSIVADRVQLDGSILAGATTRDGDGGYFTLITTHDASIGGVDVTGGDRDGFGGYLDAFVDGDLHVSGPLEAKGGEGSDIYLDAGGDLFVHSSAELNAMALTPLGDGGSISLNALGLVSVEGPVFLRGAGDWFEGGGDGGDFDIIADRVTVSAPLDIGGGHPDGTGGFFDIFAQADVLLSSTVQVDGPGQGVGGDVLVDSAGPITISGTIDLTGGFFGGSFDASTTGALALPAGAVVNVGAAPGSAAYGGTMVLSACDTTLAGTLDATGAGSIPRATIKTFTGGKLVVSGIVKAPSGVTFLYRLDPPTITATALVAPAPTLVQDPGIACCGVCTTTTSTTSTTTSTTETPPTTTSTTITAVTSTTSTTIIGPTVTSSTSTTTSTTVITTTTSSSTSTSTTTIVTTTSTTPSSTSTTIATSTTTTIASTTTTTASSSSSSSSTVATSSTSSTTATTLPLSCLHEPLQGYAAVECAMTELQDMVGSQSEIALGGRKSARRLAGKVAKTRDLVEKSRTSSKAVRLLVKAEKKVVSFEVQIAKLLANEKIADGLANELLVLAGEVTARIDGVLTPLAN